MKQTSCFRKLAQLESGHERKHSVIPSGGKEKPHPEENRMGCLNPRPFSLYRPYRFQFLIIQISIHCYVNKNPKVYRKHTHTHTHTRILQLQLLSDLDLPKQVTQIPWQLAGKLDPEDKFGSGVKRQEDKAKGLLLC